MDHASSSALGAVSKSFSSGIRIFLELVGQFGKVRMLRGI